MTDQQLRILLEYETANKVTLLRLYYEKGGTLFVEFNDEGGNNFVRGHKPNGTFVELHKFPVG